MDFLNFITSDEKIKKMFQNKEFLRFFLECEGERKKMEEKYGKDKVNFYVDALQYSGFVKEVDGILIYTKRGRLVREELLKKKNFFE
jgi:hypothetical protein